MTDFDTIDYFTDPALVADPHPYYDHLRSKCPVHPLPVYNVIAVTGYEEASEIFRNADVFSNIIAPIGPFPPLPFEPEGDDISAQIEAHRDQFPMSEHLVTFDPPQHQRTRSLLGKLLTPRRIKENEDFLWGLADRQIDEFLGTGRCEVMKEYAQPFALLTIADLLGVPEEDHEAFRIHLGAQKPGAMSEADALAHNPLEFLDTKFSAYIRDRRATPRGDVLTALAESTFPDGETPEVIELVRLATFLFGAGQDTTARLITASLQKIGEDTELQKLLREDRDRIPNFVEEMLRMEGTVKSDFRLARKTSTVGGVEIPAGTTVMINPGAVNRDPRHFEDPHEFDADRHNAREHLAFGKGIHSCPGGPLSRTEARITIERFLDRTTDITISEEHHGPAGDRRYTYEPTYILRGLTALHLDLAPVS
ncbi:cytochrome P450 [Rhodococcus triatomae]|nr:cytochrome p450 [Rhodococcus triatomae BKS 15-14]